MLKKVMALILALCLLLGLVPFGTNAQAVSQARKDLVNFFFQIIPRRSFAYPKSACPY